MDGDETAFVTTKLTVGTGVTIQNHGGVSIAGITTIGATMTVSPSGNDRISVTADAVNLSVEDNTTNAFTLKQAANEYITVDTNNSSELLTLGNSTTNPNTLILGGKTTVGTGITLQGHGGVSIAGISTLNGNVNVGGGADVTLTASIGAGSSTILFDSSAGNVTFQDNLSAKFGTGGDLAIHHDGSNTHILNSTGTLNIKSDTLRLTDASLAHLYLKGLTDAQVELYHNNNLRLTTTDDGVDIGGTGSIRVPNGTTGERNSSPQAGDFRYNTTNGEFEGYSDSWGAIAGSGGGATEVDTSVSTTSATSTGSFAKASFRSASIIAQITQGSAYQVGRYLLIHDGTTVTTLEESAVATGSMLGTFEVVINGSNVEFRVTMGSSSSATVTTKIDTVTV